MVIFQQLGCQVTLSYFYNFIKFKLGRKASRCEDDVSKKHFQQLSWQLMLSYFCNFIKFQLVASFVSLFLGVGGWVREKLIYLLLCKRQWAGHGQVGGT